MQILSFLTHTAADNKHGNKHHTQGNGQSYESHGAFIHISDSAGNQVTNEGNRCCRERVGKLRRNVVYVIRLGASRGIIGVSIMGEQWSPATAPERQAAMEIISI